MDTLRLDEPLAHALACALLTVARADGVVNEDEMGALRAILGGVVPLDDEALFFSDVGPVELRGAIDRALSAGDPYRTSALSARAEIVGAFLAAARRVAIADGDAGADELGLIAEFARALGVAGAGSA